MTGLSPLDLGVLIGYVLAVTGLGCWFFRRSGTSERFMEAGRSLPGWAVGLSILGAYVSSISFLANPGKTYAGDWNPYVFALTLPVTAWIAVKWFVPFYRRSGHVSAYHHLEHRFGAWARTYASVCFMLLQVARLGTILYLLGLALHPLLGGDLRLLILVLGVLVMVYPMLGGTEGVIWTGVVQSVVLIAGPLVCLGLILAGVPGGPAGMTAAAAEAGKWSLGSLSPSLAGSTVWVVLLYGIVTNLQNFGVDQAYIQRYLTARSDTAAGRSVWLGALLYLPIGGLFFLIGTALWAYVQSHPGLLPEGTKPDAVFPWFIESRLPSGVKGLVLASLCAAAMDSNLNCVATLFLQDLYRKYLRPDAGEREALRVLRVSVVAFGAASTLAALAMINVKSALDTWWELAGILGGGVLGLFLLGLLSRRAGSTAAGLGVAAGVVTIAWMTLSPKLDPSVPFRSPFHGLLIGVIGTAVILLVGLAASAWGSASRRDDGNGSDTY